MRWLTQYGFIRQDDSAQRNADAEAQEKKASRDKAYYPLRAAALANVGPPTHYLNGRAIGERIPDNVMLLPTTTTVARLTGKRYPCMVVPIINGEGQLQGAQITWLCADCTTKLAVSGGARRTYGKLTGGFVPLGRIDPDKPVIIAEGVETALAARQIAGLPAAIATLSRQHARPAAVRPARRSSLPPTMTTVAPDFAPLRHWPSERPATVGGCALHCTQIMAIGMMRSGKPMAM
jgi:phage/plasmid primase-like uncharacterized protein